MSADLKPLNKPQKMKLAEKHLNKYVLELKRHFDFSDFQVISLLENCSLTFKKECKINLYRILNRLIFKNQKTD